MYTDGIISYQQLHEVEIQLHLRKKKDIINNKIVLMLHI